MRRFILLLLVLISADRAQAAQNVKEIVARAVVASDATEQVSLVRSLVGEPGAAELLTLWKEGGIYIHEDDAGTRTAVTFPTDADTSVAAALTRLDDGKPLADASGKALQLSASDVESADTSSALRLAMKEVADLAALANPDPRQRQQAVEAIGNEQNAEKLPALMAQKQKETDKNVKRAMDVAIAMIELNDPDSKVRVVACQTLGNMGVISSRDALLALKKSSAGNAPEVEKAATTALAQIESHIKMVNAAATVFRGLSLGSILLVAAIGLAITFGLMGVINMAHGEMMAVGAYTTYLVQCVFGAGLPLSIFNKISFQIPGMNTTGAVYNSYFLVALPLSFLTAAMVGLLLERGIIRFLYRRPLESLLATWGVSLVMQQGFRLVFGPNNVQVGSPSWLSGNWTVNDVIFGWNRVFVVGFAIAIVIAVNLLLKKTSLGLLIRAVMQNRSMAACMGVRTSRVNMLTFALGSGLAGLAGAFMSQIGNVGPGMGQQYIVDCFMTVVVGGVGNLMGTVISALSIGLADQSLQQILGNPVLGKILVLAAIILFLQWRPSGMAAARGRGLEA